MSCARSKPARAVRTVRTTCATDPWRPTAGKGSPTGAGFPLHEADGQWKRQVGPGEVEGRCRRSHAPGPESVMIRFYRTCYPIALGTGRFESSMIDSDSERLNCSVCGVIQRGRWLLCLFRGEECVSDRRTDDSFKLHDFNGASRLLNFTL